MRLIDADAKTFPTPYKINDTEHAKGWNSCLNSISQQPTIDAEPLVHGRWIQTDKADIVWRECSVCGDRRISTWLGKNVKSFNYCPKCGAKMDGGAGE